VTGLTLDGADARQLRSELAEGAAITGVGRDMLHLAGDHASGQPGCDARPGLPVPRLPGRHGGLGRKVPRRHGTGPLLHQTTPGRGGGRICPWKACFLTGKPSISKNAANAESRAAQSV
jgi:hypothetical protein